jgi:hypothetical protein
VAKDIFPNIVYASVVESAANTLTFQKIETGYGSLQKTAWIIQRIEWYLSASARNLIVAADDSVSAALVTSNLITALDLAQAALIDLYEYKVHYQTSVGFVPTPDPVIRDFAELSGGGRLVLPYPLYVAVKGTSIASAVTVKCRISFVEKELSDSDWMELVQQTRLLS